MKSFTAGKNEDGARLSRFVENVTSGMPKSLLYKAFRNKRIKVNGKKARRTRAFARATWWNFTSTMNFFRSAAHGQAPSP